MTNRRAWALLLTLAGAALPVFSALGGDGAPSVDVPAYESPSAAAADAALDPKLAAGVETALRTILDPLAPVDLVAAETRRLAGIGPRALPRIVTALRGAPWRARTRLVAAIAEMDAPDATPILVAGSRDPSFAVREAAVVGLGKTGDTRAAAPLLARTSRDEEPAWRVRAAAATAVRRAVLRGVLDRTPAGPALAALLADPDPDAARAALAAASPLALPEALPGILAVFADRSRSADDRKQALVGLRAYREPSPEIFAALRRGFLQGNDPMESVRAARALFDMRGIAALEDEVVSDAVVHNLPQEAGRDMREALVSLGPPARPWIESRLAEAAARLRMHRGEPTQSPWEHLLDALLQLDEEAGIAAIRAALTGAEADGLPYETRRVALRKAWFSYAARMGKDLRALLVSPAGRDIAVDALRAVAASGGDDVAGFVDAALRDSRSEMRSAALEILKADPSIPTPPSLVSVAERTDRPRQCRSALAALGSRDGASAARIALKLLAHPDPEMREAAITEIGATRAPEHAEALRRRLREEDGASSEAPRTADQPPLPPAAVTGSDVAETNDRNRRLLRSALLRALRAVAGPAARPDLLAALRNDPDLRARVTAVQELRGIAAPEDAPVLVAQLGKETDDEARAEIRRLLATQGDSPAACALFQADLADATLRNPSLDILSEERSTVLPEGLEKGLFDPSWDDDARVFALRVFERRGRRLPASELEKLTRSSHTLELATAACRALASDPSPEAVQSLSRLLADESDPARRSVVVRAIGDRGAVSLVSALADLLDSTRRAALGAAGSTEPAFHLYRECAIALGRLATEDAGRTLVRHLLDPSLAAAGARCSVARNGPFQPEEGPTARVLRTLVAAAAHLDEAALARIVDAELLARRADGSDFCLDEEYLDGLASYFADPVAFRLPPRVRPSAALPFWQLVAAGPPRWSSLDSDAAQRAAGELESQGRYREALRWLETSIAVADVEDAARSREDRLWERAKCDALRAREAAASGRTDESLRLVATLRAGDPSSADLAFLHGWCLLKLGRAGPEAVTSLRDALARDRQHASACFWLAYATESLEGAERGLACYAEAVQMDNRRVQYDGQAESGENRDGLRHSVAAYAYWHARALAATGRRDQAGAPLRAAIRLDDRCAALALADKAFADCEDREEFVAETLAGISDEPLK